MKAYKRFLSYSYEPFRLHFCGPQDDASTKLVDDFLKGFDISAARLNRVARDFAGVYPYLELIAKKNKLEPLDEQVIEAYWIGNNLLRQVTVEDLKNLILQSFIGPGKLSLSAGERLAGRRGRRARLAARRALAAPPAGRRGAAGAGARGRRHHAKRYVWPASFWIYAGWAGAG